ncbi:MAG: alkane 1-monooxygenase [Deltaproteobacteria bacterium]|nr:alkane 1-monooxygenase [Deltaproteobacteria bacterium]
MTAVFPFFLLLVFPVAAAVSLYLGGLWLLLAPALAFVLMPAIDFLMDRVKRPEAIRLAVSPSGEVLAAALLHGYVVLQLLLLGLGIIRVPDLLEQRGWLEVFGLVLTFGIMTGGIGITIAHELVHRRESFSYWSGVMLLCSVFYGHFAIEHVLGHHSHVGTRQDPATARRGENVWFFAVRSVFMGVLSANAIEKLRLSRLGKAWGSSSNRIFKVWAISLLFATFAGSVGGWMGLLFFVLQAVVAVLLLEFINYVEHYGLERKILENGKPEPVQLWHSWDSSSRLSGWILIHLSRHADHHKYPARPFTKLEGSKSSPHLPASYPACVLLATVPPLWYRVMNRRIDNFEGSRS